MIECICCHELEGITLKIATSGCESRQLIRHNAAVLVRQLFITLSLIVSVFLVNLFFWGFYLFFFPFCDVSKSFVVDQKFALCELLTSAYLLATDFKTDEPDVRSS